ncbi:hypothetical protein PUN28_010836 [Cardiocondyla obscurior]|uniref:Uncharacterized protein n=1 Tax=Cardiocondyla obscurior TaxID=286306 RepID=A0AAW2FMH7_9HYME
MCERDGAKKKIERERKKGERKSSKKKKKKTARDMYRVRECRVRSCVQRANVQREEGRRLRERAAMKVTQVKNYFDFRNAEGTRGSQRGRNVACRARTEEIISYGRKRVLRFHRYRRDSQRELLY